MDKHAKLQDALKEYLETLKNAQISRAHTIETHLKSFEEKLASKLRTVDDYIALSNHQRRCMGIEEKGNSSTPVTININAKGIDV